MNGAVVAAGVDPDQVEQMTAHVTAAGSPVETEFAGDRLIHRADEDGVVAAAQPGSGLAHQWNPPHQPHGDRRTGRDHRGDRRRPPCP
ncbi:hypothetical protein [Streptomyces sp. NPDC001770]